MALLTFDISVVEIYNWAARSKLPIVTLSSTAKASIEILLNHLVREFKVE